MTRNRMTELIFKVVDGIRTEYDSVVWSKRYVEYWNFCCQQVIDFKVTDSMFKTWLIEESKVEIMAPGVSKSLGGSKHEFEQFKEACIELANTLHE